MRPWSDFSDEELVAKVQQCYQAAFNELVERYTAKVYSQARAMTRSGQEADGIVQETFLKAFKHIDKFSVSKAKFRTWLFTIARNQSINVFWKCKGSPFFQVSVTQNSPMLISDLSGSSVCTTELVP